MKQGNPNKQVQCLDSCSCSVSFSFEKHYQRLGEENFCYLLVMVAVNVLLQAFEVCVHVQLKAGEGNNLDQAAAAAALKVTSHTNRATAWFAIRKGSHSNSSSTSTKRVETLKKNPTKSESYTLQWEWTKKNTTTINTRVVKFWGCYLSWWQCRRSLFHIDVG